MKTGVFSSAREAKEFLVARILEEAQREGVTLSEVERKMLYFTETGWAPPGIMEVGEEFDRTCDRAEYEEKIAKLLRAMGEELNLIEYEDCLAAIRKLREEDHYILVIAQQGGLTAAAFPDTKKEWRKRMVTFVAVLMAGLLLLLLHYTGGIGRRPNHGNSVTYTGLEHVVSSGWFLLAVVLVLVMLGSLFKS